MLNTKTRTTTYTFIVLSTVIVLLSVPSTATASDLTGRWNSSIGLVYDITQAGQTMSWKVTTTPQTATGTVQGDTVNASWKGPRSTGSATGKIVRDQQGRAIRIEWSNGVVFTRKTPAAPSAAGSATFDLTGTWGSTIGHTYQIAQQGTSFTWDVAKIGQKATGQIQGNSVNASWQGPRGTGSAKGTVELDSQGRALKIKWSNGVVFTRQLSSTGQATTPQTPSTGQPSTQVPSTALPSTQIPLVVRPSAQIALGSGTLYGNEAAQLQQLPDISTAGDLINNVGTPSQLSSLSQRSGVSEERLLFMAKELEMIQVLGTDQISSTDLQLLKDLDVESVKTLAEFEEHSEVLHSMLVGQAAQRGVSPPSQQQVSAWVSGAASAAGTSLPAAEYLLPQQAPPVSQMNTKAVLDWVLDDTVEPLLPDISGAPMMAYPLGTEPGSFVIDKGKLQHTHEFVALRPGLYRAKITLKLPLTFGQVSVRCRVDAPEVTVASPTQQFTISNRSQWQNMPTVFDSVTVSGTETVIKSNHDLAQNSLNYYLFWVSKSALPMTAGLRLRLEVVGYVSPKHSDGVEDFTAKTSIADHPPIGGVIEVDRIDPVQIKALETAEAIPSSYAIDSPLVVLETSFIQKNIDKSTHLPSFLTVMLANAPTISTEISNQKVYEVLSDEHPGGSVHPLPVLRGGERVSGRSQLFTTLASGKYAFDGAGAQSQPFSGVEVMDIKEPASGIFEILAPTTPSGHRPDFELLATEGEVYSTGWTSSSVSHEVWVTTRGLHTGKRLVAELAALQVSGQSEPDDDDNDEGLGEFKVLTSAMLSQRKPLADLDGGQGGAGGLPLLQTWVRGYPVRPDHMAPAHTYIRTDPVSGKTVCLPHMPVFDLSENFLKHYKDLAVTVSVVEDDAHTWWQENSVLIKRMIDFYKAVYAIYKNPASGLTEIQKGIIPLFDEVNLEDVDDTMGHPSVAVSYEGQWGLLSDSEYTIVTTGTSNAGAQSFVSFPDSGVSRGRIVMTSNTPNAAAFIRMKAIPSIFSWSEVYLTGFTLRESSDGPGETTNVIVKLGLPEYELNYEYVPPHWKQAGVWPTMAANAAAGQPFHFPKPPPPPLIKSQVADVYLPDTKLVSDSGIIETEAVLSLGSADRHRMWKGFTYFQAELWDDDPDGDEFLGLASYTLYHDDVWKYAGEGPQKRDSNRVVVNSYKLAGTPYYVAEITLRDTGSWLKEVNLLAYVYIAE